MILLNSFDEFWRKCPALLYGISLFLGICLYYLPLFNLMIPIFLLLFLFPFALFKNFKNLSIRLGLALFVLLTGYIYASAFFPLVKVPLQGIHGKAVLSFHSIQKRRTIMGLKWFTEARLHSFEMKNGEKLGSLDARIIFPVDDSRFVPSFDKTWEVEGYLKQSRQIGKCLFKVSATSGWHPLGSDWKGKLAVLRESIKSKVKEYFESVMEVSRSAPFLAGMVTGQFEDTILTHSFSKFGVQHILAISGFHFSLIAMTLGFLMSLFFSKRKTMGLLAILLTGYFVILGASASIFRAWMTAFLSCLAYLFQRTAFALNSLGIALGAVCLFDPYCFQQLGFQYSFAITASILLFSQPLDRLLKQIIPTRPLSTAINWDFTKQHIYILLSGLRSLFALTGSVNLVAIPLILFHSQSFPLLSLLYNLFFPFLVSVSMLLLIIATIIHPFFSYIGLSLHSLNGYFTYFLIGLALDAPPILDFTISVPEFSAFYPIFFLSALFFGGIVLQNTQTENEFTLL